MFDMAPFALPSAFWNPSYTRGSLWLEHLPFCFWAVEAARPSTMVITGTADGVPHFALCEAVLRLRLETQCLAILQHQPSTEIAAYNEENFCEFSRFEVASGRDAFALAPPGIDLLVLADHGLGGGNLEDLWETWLPKLSERAVVLVPRIEETSDAAGGWNRIRNEYPHHVFHHGGGMGVVGVGGALPELFHHLFNLKDSRHSALVRAMFARLGAAVAESHRHAVAKRAVQRADAGRDAVRQELEKTHARLSAVEADFEAAQRRCNTAEEQLQQARTHADVLESELRSALEKLRLRSEHAERVTAAVEALKRDHEANKARLFEARRLAARAEAENKRNIDQLRAELKLSEHRVRGIKGEAAGIREKLKHERKLRAEAQTQLQKILESRSWALTAPFRKVMARIRSQ
ncbi:MAG: hypothetical protein GX761_03670 [Gammaproteobacteria bacterium]|nr:hypothetical protein [Gammaproteobacteria bacterium]